MRTTWEEAGWERIGDGVGRRRLPGWDETVGAVAGATGLLVVDAGATLAEGGALAHQVTAIVGGPVTHLALTHPHFDHVLGAAAFTGDRPQDAGGVAVYAAVGAAEALSHGREELLRDARAHGMPHEAVEEAAAAPVVPGHGVSDTLTVDLGDRQVLLANVGPGHTAHDLAVVVPEREGHPAVVFCGDLVEESGEPQAGPDAVPARWPAALDRLLSLGGEHAHYVPGHGRVVDARFVREQRDTLARRFGVSRS
ncbi:MBL fold metallo-hydrolase [Streptomyces sp. NPDC059740]|uniref:MBL fold metallo-hydrolase n=1 Tax=Streptomyces sp. NPDC059740 TaxID=3346926 RepID=UPI0036555E6D